MRDIEVDAVYQDGVFKPVEPLDLPEGTRVWITCDPAEMIKQAVLQIALDPHALTQHAPLQVTVEPTGREPTSRRRGSFSLRPWTFLRSAEVLLDRVATVLREQPELRRWLNRLSSRVDPATFDMLSRIGLAGLLALLGILLLVPIGRLLQRGFPGSLEGLWGLARALRSGIERNLTGLSMLVLAAAVLVSPIWWQRRGKAGLVPASLTISLGLALTAEMFALRGLFAPAGLVAGGAVAALAAGLWLSRGRVGEALEPVAWSRRREYLLLALVLAVVVFTRFYLLGSVPYGVEGDESSWALQITDAMAQTDAPRPYPFSRIPTSYWMQGLFYRLFGISIVTARWEVAVFSIVATVLFYFAVREMVNVPVALIATYLLGVSLIDLAASRQAHVEAHIKVWIMLAVFAVFFGYRRRQLLFFLLAGIGLALGLMVYDSFALAPAAVFAYAIYRLLRERRDWRQHLLYIGVMLLPVLVVGPGVWRYLSGRRVSQVTVLSHAVGIYPDSFQNALRIIPKLPGFMVRFAGITLEILTRQQQQDVLIGRPGPLESAALMPFLLLGLVMAVWCWQRRHVVFVLFWLLVPALPTTLILGQPFARTFYPFLGALLILAAIALWVLHEAFRQDLHGRLRWVPTVGLAVFLGLLGLSNTYAYFNEVRDPRDRLLRRELGDLLVRHIAPGEMVYLPYLPLRDDFLEIEWRYPRFVVRGQIPAGTEDQYYRAIPYAELLKEISATRAQLTGVKVIYDKTISQPAERQRVLQAFRRCYPQHWLEEGRFFDVYGVSAEGLALARCYSHAELRLLKPESDQTIGLDVAPLFVWQVENGDQTSFRLQLERHDDQIIWVEAEEFSEDNGWQAQAHLTTGFTGRAYLADVVPSNTIAARKTVDLPEAARYEIWVRSFRRVNDDSPVFLKVAGLALEVSRPGSVQLKQWQWESLGWHELPAGPQEFAFTRRFGDDPHMQIFIDSLVLSRQEDFDPRRDTDWVSVLDTGSVASPQSEFCLAQPLGAGHYRWQVEVLDGDRLVDWDGSPGITSAFGYFRVER